MIGPRYWSTGITLTYVDGGWGGSTSAPEPRLWQAKVEYFDDGFCDTGSTEGTLRTRYQLPTLREAVDLIKADAERLGIEWKTPTLYMRGDGEDDEYPPPRDWEQMLADECDRIGWRETYLILSGMPVVSRSDDNPVT